MFGTSLLFALIVLQPAQPVQTSDVVAVTLLSDVQKQDVRCSAAFAIIASEQERGVPWALEWPRLSMRGKDFFSATGLELVQQTGLSQEEVGGLMVAEVSALQNKSTQEADPNTVINAMMKPCMDRLDQKVPPLDPPDLITCAGIFQLAYDEVHAADGLTSDAMDLKTLATVLEDRARKELLAEGKSANESDQILAEAREAFAAASAARTEAGAHDPVDYDHCFDLAAPEPTASSPHF